MMLWIILLVIAVFWQATEINELRSQIRRQNSKIARIDAAVRRYGLRDR